MTRNFERAPLKSGSGFTLQSFFRLKGRTKKRIFTAIPHATAQCAQVNEEPI